MLGTDKAFHPSTTFLFHQGLSLRALLSSYVVISCTISSEGEPDPPPVTEASEAIHDGAPLVLPSLFAILENEMDGRRKASAADAKVGFTEIYSLSETLGGHS